MKEIVLFNNKGIVFVDNEDYEWLISLGNYFLYAKKYAGISRKGIKSGIHRLIMEKHYGKSNLDVDHKDRNPLNNQKLNLRYATESQNNGNCEKRTFIGGTHSKFKGVGRNKKKWSAAVKYKGERFRIGNFDTERECAIAYNLKAKELFGEFALLNIIDNLTQDEINNVINQLNNVKKIKNTHSKYRGVTLNKGRWQAEVSFNKQTFYLGRFINENDAALAYNKKAKELYGDKAKLNIVS